MSSALLVLSTSRRGLQNELMNKCSEQVRKAAVRILWEACIRVEGFPKAAEACVAVLQRVADNEGSIHELVAKVFHGLWFATTIEGKSVASMFLVTQTLLWPKLLFGEYDTMGSGDWSTLLHNRIC